MYKLIDRKTGKEIHEGNFVKLTGVTYTAGDEGYIVGMIEPDRENPDGLILINFISGTRVIPPQFVGCIYKLNSSNHLQRNLSI